MKRTPIVSMVAFTLLSVFLVSCGMQQSMTDEDFDQRADGRHFYNNNPWLGPNTIVVERDPFTGRLYQISPGGFYSPLGYDPWLFSPGPRVIAPRGGGWYSGPRIQGQGRNVPPTQPRTQQGQRQNNDAARDQILGPRRQN